MAWPSKKSIADNELASRPTRPSMNTSKRRSDSSRLSAGGQHETSDEFGDVDLDDADLLQAASAMSDLDFAHIDNYGTDAAAQTKKNTSKNARQKQSSAVASDWQPRQLDNGKWACNHACKDKNSCKHMCCREGVDKPPKAPKKWAASADANHNALPKKNQSKRNYQKAKRH